MLVMPLSEATKHCHKPLPVFGWRATGGRMSALEANLTGRMDKLEGELGGQMAGQKGEITGANELIFVC
jgi:hypothetical protein